MTQKTIQTDKILKGVGLGLSAFFVFTCMSAIAKILTDDYHPAEIVFWRNLLFMPFMFIFLRQKYGMAVFKPFSPIGVFLRAFIGSTGMIVTYEVFKRLPLAEATVLLFTAVLMVPVIAHFVLKERIGLHRAIAILVGFLGIFVMVGPTGNFYLAGALWGLFAACFHAGAQVALRFLKNENAVMVTFYFVLAGVIIPGLFFMPFIGIGPQSTSAWALFAFIAVLGFIAQMLFTYAFKYAPASVITPLSYTGLIWATGFDIFIWQNIPGWPVFAGAGFIIFSKMYMIWREHKAEQRTLQKI